MNEIKIKEIKITNCYALAVNFGQKDLEQHYQTISELHPEHSSEFLFNFDDEKYECSFADLKLMLLKYRVQKT